MSELKTSIDVKPNKFKAMPRFRILNFFTRGFSCIRGDDKRSQRIHLPEGLDYLSDQIRYFRWDYFPLKSLPFTIFVPIVSK